MFSVPNAMFFVVQMDTSLRCTANFRNTYIKEMRERKKEKTTKQTLLLTISYASYAVFTLRHNFCCTTFKSYQRECTQCQVLEHIHTSNIITNNNMHFSNYSRFDVFFSTFILFKVENVYNVHIVKNSYEKSLCWMN